jgi:hypothetical protein
MSDPKVLGLFGDAQDPDAGDVWKRRTPASYPHRCGRARL